MQRIMVSRILFVPALAVLAVCACSDFRNADQNFEHTGAATIIDGDTLDIRENRYRFDGVDSPERGARCGAINVYQQASLFLADLAEGKNVECVPNGKKNGARLIATCFALVPDGERINLSERLVSSGWARDWPKYSGGRFSELERAARAENLGIWGLDCPNDLWGDREYE